MALFLVIQMLPAEIIIISMEKGKLILLLISIMVSNVERFPFLVGQISSQHAAEKGHAQNR
jgi:hypothetical protein